MRGAQDVARQALLFSRLAGSATPVRVNGEAGIIAWLPDGAPMCVMGFTVKDGRIAAITQITDRAGLGRLGLDTLRG